MSRYQVGRYQGDKFIIESEHDDLQIASEKCNSLNAKKEQQVPSRVCDECANPKDREQVLKLIEFHKYRIEILCDHFGLDPACWLAEDADTEH